MTTAAARPVLLTVDDDPQVLRMIERDLRSKYAEHYRVTRAQSGAEALDLLRQLQLRNDPVALFLVDQRMPSMNGVEFLREAVTMYPLARKVLLTAYADTEAAIQAINEVHIDNYLLKPWNPPEERLYPVITDLLDDWMSEFRPPFTGVRLLGTRWSPQSHQIRDFLSRNRIPYQWLEMERRESDPEVDRIAEAARIGQDAALPVVIFEDGSVLEQPDTAEIAARLGLGTKASAQFYDLTIVGGGPGGLAAAVYGASEGLGTVMIEREAPGGQAGMSSRIENYLGFPDGLSGSLLADRAVKQARRFGVEILAPQEAVALRVDGQYRVLQFRDNTEISCHALLIATGVQYRKLDVPGMERLAGAGVYYGAAMTEAISCKNETVYVVGAANSAGQAAMHFSRYASEVIMLVRSAGLAATMSDYLIRQIASTPNIRVAPFSEVVEVFGAERLEGMTLECKRTGEKSSVPASSLFIFIGAAPRTDWLEGVVERDKYGFIVTGPDLIVDGKPPRGWQLDRQPYLLESSVPGVFAVGDVRHGSVKRVATSVGEGAMAVAMVHQYLATLGR
ncbi:MAG TPA: FAD-dependent oxidoreductase [Bryobacteraceae bacterium]|nr:FAD-dependent oxidoreductase [Bryobacteraceae bacterium]